MPRCSEPKIDRMVTSLDVSLRSSRVVDDALFERQLQRVVAHTNDPDVGIFGPESVSWKINREAILFMGAGRATLLQLAHPWIAAAMAQHSNIKTDVVGRFHRTFRIVFSMVFGTLDQALHTARIMHSRHHRITGPLVNTQPSSQHYSANDIDAMLWVYATLIETAAKMYEAIFPPLTDEQKEQYYRESWLFGFLFGLPEEAFPQTWQAFLDYNRTMWSSNVLTVTTAGKELGQFLMYDLWEDERYDRRQLAHHYRALTLGFLPEPILTQYGFEFGEDEQRVAENTLRWIRRIYPYLPKQVRFVPSYHEAQYRIIGQRQPNWLIRYLNTHWVGQPTLVS